MPVYKPTESKSLEQLTSIFMDIELTSSEAHYEDRLTDNEYASVV